MTSNLDKQEGGNHYKNLKIQPVEYIYANDIPFIEGCIIKYATRWKDKNGIEDLKKIIHFAELLIELEGKKNVTVRFLCSVCGKVSFIPVSPGRVVYYECLHCGSNKVRLV